MSKQEFDHLSVVMNGRVIGSLERLGPKRMRLLYADDVAADQTPLSVRMPVSSRRYREATVLPWIRGLFPDRPELIRQWRRAFGLQTESDFDLLGHVGEDVAGAAQFVVDGRLDEVLQRRGVLRFLSEAHVAEMLRLAMQSLPVGIGGVSEGKFSLGGAQAKVALQLRDQTWADPEGAQPSTHIVKPSIPGLDDQDLVEDVTMKVAGELGLRVARTWVQQFDDVRALVVERFDRTTIGPQIVRIHQEDMAQALGIDPRRKYEAYGGPSAIDVVSLLQRTSSDPDTDVTRFVQALIFNWLVCGTDAHARNYSLLLQGDNVRLAPLYDLNSYLAFGEVHGLELSMSIADKYEAASIGAHDWLGSARLLGVSVGWMRAELDRQIALLPQALRGVTEGLPALFQNSRAVERLRTNVDGRIMGLAN